MDFRKEVCPWNHVVLWAKNWYRWKGREHTSWLQPEQILEELNWCIERDGYYAHFKRMKDLANFLLCKYDQYSEWCRANNTYGSCCKMSTWQFMNAVRDIQERMKGWEDYDMSLDEAIVYTVIKQFEFIHRDDIVLAAPVYDRKSPMVYGQATPGMTYKHMNDIAKRNFRYYTDK